MEFYLSFGIVITFNVGYLLTFPTLVSIIFSILAQIYKGLDFGTGVGIKGPIHDQYGYFFPLTVLSNNIANNIEAILLMDQYTVWLNSG